VSTRMTAEEAITRIELRTLVDRYAWALDSGDAKTYADTFTPDGELSQCDPGEQEPSFVLKGREELLTAPGTERLFVKHFHSVQNHNVQVHGDTATGVTYVTVHHLFQHEGAWKTLVVLVHLYDSYRLTDDGW
jgi:hypothetical protein